LPLRRTDAAFQDMTTLQAISDAALDPLYDLVRWEPTV
jgi:hypothetical protein